MSKTHACWYGLHVHIVRVVWLRQKYRHMCIYIYIYTYIHMCIYIHVSNMQVCMQVGRYVGMKKSTCVCTYVCMYVCMYVSMYVLYSTCMQARMHVLVCIYTWCMQVCMHADMYVSVCNSIVCHCYCVQVYGIACASHLPAMHLHGIVCNSWYITVWSCMWLHVVACNCMM